MEVYKLWRLLKEEEKRKLRWLGWMKVIFVLKIVIFNQSVSSFFYMRHNELAELKLCVIL